MLFLLPLFIRTGMANDAAASGFMTNDTNGDLATALHTIPMLASAAPFNTNVTRTIAITILFVFMVYSSHFLLDFLLDFCLKYLQGSNENT